MSLFVTGTDTNVGKTLISAWLCRHYPYEYWKPIQTGAAGYGDVLQIQKNRSAAILPSIYNLAAPVSPLQAAMEENIMIDTTLFRKPLSPTIIEGAGGVMVPLTPHFMMADLIKSLAVPCLIVASAKLGTINHILLTIEALKNRKIPILGIILNQTQEEHYGSLVEILTDIPLLQIMPYLKYVTGKVLETIKPSPKLQDVIKNNIQAC